MIKIEFKEAHGMIPCTDIYQFVKVKTIYFPMMTPFYANNVESVSFGCPSELVPSRSEILTQLGITEQEDELFQQQYKNV